MAPALGVAKEETLVAVQAIEYRRWFVAQRNMIVIERHQGSTEIGDILAHGEVALHAETWKGLVGVELSAERGSALIKLAGIRIRPPTGEDAGAVVFAPLVIEPVDHFVPNNGADAAVVNRRVRCRVEEGRLKYPGGKSHLIPIGVVRGIHRLRIQVPFFAVNRRIQPVDLPQPGELARGVDISDEVV